MRTVAKVGISPTSGLLNTSDPSRRRSAREERPPHLSPPAAPTEGLIKAEGKAAKLEASPQGAGGGFGEGPGGVSEVVEGQESIQVGKGGFDRHRGTSGGGPGEAAVAQASSGSGGMGGGAGTPAVEGAQAKVEEVATPLPPGVAVFPPAEVVDGQGLGHPAAKSGSIVGRKRKRCAERTVTPPVESAEDSKAQSTATADPLRPPLSCPPFSGPVPAATESLEAEAGIGGAHLANSASSPVLNLAPLGVFPYPP